jgi:hypothetical protein
MWPTGRSSWGRALNQSYRTIADCDGYSMRLGTRLLDVTRGIFGKRCAFTTDLGLPRSVVKYVEGHRARGRAGAAALCAFRRRPLPARRSCGTVPSSGIRQNRRQQIESYASRHKLSSPSRTETLRRSAAYSTPPMWMAARSMDRNTARNTMPSIPSSPRIEAILSPRQRSPTATRRLSGHPLLASRAIVAQRRGGAAWPERDAVGDGRLPGVTKIGTRPTRKDYPAPCRNAAGSHRSRQTATRYGRVCHR